MLELEGLTRRYGSVVALDELSFTVPEGRMFGFLGPNGAEKTTTMRTILGLSKPDAGAVRWRGAPVGPDERLRFGYMPEERGLYPKMKVREHITYLAGLHGLSSAEASSATDGWLERLGLDQRRDDNVDTLSQGNQQRVQLAAAVVHEPELLVLDEPFSGLDPVAVDTLADVLWVRSARPRPRPAKPPRPRPDWPAYEWSWSPYPTPALPRVPSGRTTSISPCWNEGRRAGSS